MALCDGALAVAALLAMVQISYGLFVRPATQQRPDFLACDYPAPCGLSARSVHMGRVLRAGYAKAQEVARAGRKPIIVVVGADDLGNTAIWSDMHLYRTVLKQIGVPPGQVRMALVEPLQEKDTKIWYRIGELPVDASQVQVVNAVLDGECKQGHRIVYSISRQAGVDFGFDSNAVQGWSSLDKGHPLKIVTVTAFSPSFYCGANGASFQLNCVKGMRAFAQAANRSSYIMQRKVQCMTLKELLRSTGSDARDVAMLIVDAEEHDTAIIRPMLDDPAFEPGFIMYEGGLNDKDNGLLPKLRARGYSVGAKSGGLHIIAGMGDAHNVVAVRLQRNQPVANATATAA